MEPLHGLLDMLVLRTLVLGPLHGYGIAKAIRNTSKDALDIEFGSLYPSLKRLELKGWIASKWEISEHNRRAKYYRLTPVGRKQLHEEHSQWRDFVSAISLVMETEPAKE
jgi:PadR family transcriptional regulator, regulatory protein PadR